MKNTVSNIIWPNLEFGAQDDMYVRLENDNVHLSHSQKRLFFRPGGRASFDTFFNALTVDVWKKQTCIENLSLVLVGGGRFLVKFGLHRLGHRQRWLGEELVELNGQDPSTLDLPFFGNLESGLLHFAVEALSEGELTSAQFVTSSPPAREVKLGIVITHFEREEQVRPAVARLRGDLLKDPELKDDISLIVVDNSRTLRAEDVAGATLLPNENFGGAGGFMRGLLHLKDQGDFTHCLFMDDDASCESESIRRTHTLLSYLRDENTCVAGSLLRALHPEELFEKAAKFDGLCRPLKSGLDMRKTIKLLEAENHEEMPDYSGWWFFAFPLAKVKNLAFPFFVRGDDIRFGLDNRWSILTTNGIACWGDDFGSKNSPLLYYLDARNHAIALLTVVNCGFLKLLRIAWHFVGKQLLSYNYASAEAALLGFRHVLAGPDFFVDNLDTAEIRRQIAGFEPKETMGPLPRGDHGAHHADVPDKLPRIIWRYLTMNGFFLPRFALRRGRVLQQKCFQATLSEVFRWEAIYYQHTASGTGYIAYHDKKRFFGLIAEFLAVMRQYAVNFRRLGKVYEEAWPRLTSEAFWRSVYSSAPTPHQKSPSDPGHECYRKTEA